MSSELFLLKATAQKTFKLDHSVGRKIDLLGIKLPRHYGGSREENQMAEKQADLIRSQDGDLS